MNLGEIKARHGFTTDKGNHYLEVYDEFFGKLKNNPIKLLEIGIFKGESLKLWSEYFQNGKIFGIDLNIPDVNFKENVFCAQADQASPTEIERALSGWGIDAFDIIIDDASHFGTLSAASFSTLFSSRLSAGGFYVVEDWGTGYWPDWPDGEALAASPLGFQNPQYPPYDKTTGNHRVPSHTAGMAGFVKSLVDLVGAQEPGGISELVIRPGIVVAQKSRL